MGNNCKLYFFIRILATFLIFKPALTLPIENITLISEHIKDAVDQAILPSDEFNDVEGAGRNPPILPLVKNLSSITLELDEVLEHHKHGVHVVSFKFEYVKAELVLCAFIILIGLFKLIYHEMPFIKEWLPESCCLIALGCAIGGFIR